MDYLQRMDIIPLIAQLPARISQEALTGAALDVLEWPAKNPDINIIKNVWSVLLRRIYGMNPLSKIQLSVLQRARWKTEHHISAHTAISFIMCV